MLKVQFHTHTSSDPHDRWISYSNKELIDRAAERKFDVLAITCHQKIIFSEEIKAYAQEKGILLIPGVEIRIEGCDVLILNATKKAEKINSFKDLKRFRYKNTNSAIIAPHPYYKHHSLGKKLEKHLDLFDAIEFSFFYSNFINPNRKIKKLGLPLLGTGDVHFIDFIDSTYSEIEAEKSTYAIIKALKQGKIKIETKTLSIPRMTGIISKMSLSKIKTHLSI